MWKIKALSDGCLDSLYTAWAHTGLESNFEKVNPSIATTQGVPYDFDSIMHYGARAFSRNGQNTVEPISSSIPIRRLGQRDGFSSSDLQHVNGLYCSSGE